MMATGQYLLTNCAVLYKLQKNILICNSNPSKMSENEGMVSRNLQKKMDEIKETEIIVGIPSFNNAKTIGHVVRAVQAGLTKYFPENRAVIVNSDGGSTDGTYFRK